MDQEVGSNLYFYMDIYMRIQSHTGQVFHCPGYLAVQDQRHQYSVLEIQMGRRACLNLAQNLSLENRAP